MPFLRAFPRQFWQAVVLGTTVVASACAHTFDARTLGANVTVASPPGTPPCVTPFRRSEKAVFVLWGLTAARRPSLEHALAAQVTGQDEIRDLRIKVGSSFTDLLFTAISAGLVVPRTVTFDGCVVRR